jgi:hypothetical protein
VFSLLCIRDSCLSNILAIFVLDADYFRSRSLIHDILEDLLQYIEHQLFVTVLNLTIVHKVVGMQAF